MLILLVASGPQKGQVLELDEDRPRELGRHCFDLPIQDSRMSRKHARLTPRQGKWFLEDLQSTNGTYVNGQPIIGSVELQNGDRVQVGKTYFVVSQLPSQAPRLQPPEEARRFHPPASPPDAAPPVHAVLPTEPEDVTAAPSPEAIVLTPDPDDSGDMVSLSDDATTVVEEESPPEVHPDEARRFHPPGSPPDIPPDVPQDVPPEVPPEETPAQSPPLVVNEPEAVPNPAPGAVQVIRRPGVGNEENILAVIRLADLPAPLREQLLSGKLLTRRRVWPWFLAAAVVLAALAGANAWYFHHHHLQQQRLNNELLDQLRRAAAATSTVDHGQINQDLLAKLREQIESAATEGAHEQRKLYEQLAAQLQALRERPQPQTIDPELLKSIQTRVDELAAIKPPPPAITSEDLERLAQRDEQTQELLKQVLAELEQRKSETPPARSDPEPSPPAMAQPVPVESLDPSPAAPVASESFQSVVFLVDASGAMIDAQPMVLEELNRQIVSLAPGQKFTVIFFQNGRAVEWSPAGLRQAGESNKRLALEWASPQRPPVVPSGSSNPVAALRLALGYQPDRVRILAQRITGSRSNEVPRDELMTLVNQLNGDQRTRIDTVQFFNLDDHATLADLASATGGSHRVIGSDTAGGGDERASPQTLDPDLLDALRP